MKAHWQKLQQQLDSRSLRERLLIFATLASVFLFLFHGLALQPLKAARQKYLGEIGTTQARLAQLDRELAQLQALYRRDPDLALRRQIEALETQLALGEHPLTEITRGMIAPGEMAAVIERILRHNRRLSVLKLENLPPAPLLTAQATGEAEGDEGEKEDDHDELTEIPIYKHGLRLEVSGSYAQLVALLRDIENQPWRILWDEVELSSEDYPRSRLELMIYTLSFEADWLVV